MGDSKSSSDIVLHKNITLSPKENSGCIYEQVETYLN